MHSSVPCQWDWNWDGSCVLYVCAKANQSILLLGQIVFPNKRVLKRKSSQQNSFEVSIYAILGLSAQTCFKPHFSAISRIGSIISKGCYSWIFLFPTWFFSHSNGNFTPHCFPAKNNFYRWLTMGRVLGCSSSSSWLAIPLHSLRATNKSIVKLNLERAIESEGRLLCCCCVIVFSINPLFWARALFFPLLHKLIASELFLLVIHRF